MVGELQKDAADYKDSIELLGLGFNELETFLNPKKGIKPYDNKSASRLTGNMTSSSKEDLNGDFLERIDRLEYLLDSNSSAGSEMQ